MGNENACCGPRVNPVKLEQRSHSSKNNFKAPQKSDNLFSNINEARYNQLSGMDEYEYDVISKKSIMS